MTCATKYRFPRGSRLLKTDDFSSVFSLRCQLSGVFFQVYGRPNGLESARMGVVVGRKADRRAVARNYIKRTARETFRLKAAELGSLDFVVRARRSFSRKEGAQARAELLTLLGKMVRKCRA